MQKIVFYLFLMFRGITTFCQQEFFIYLQTDNHQPFYAKINSSIYSSAENGYLIIPKLEDSIYYVSVGFPKNPFPEQSFAIAINKKDKGFQLKNLGEKGWTLVNLQNASVIMNSGLPLKTMPEFFGTRKTDAFSEMLATVVNDSAILYSAVKQKSPEVITENKTTLPDTTRESTSSKKDSTTNAITVTIRTVPVNQPDSLSKNGIAITQSTPNTTLSQGKTNNINPINNKPDSSKLVDAHLPGKEGAEKPFITRIEEKKTDKTYEAIYLEQYNFSTDTIIVTILLADSTISIANPDPPIIVKKYDSIPPPMIVSSERTVPPKPVVIDSASSLKRSIQLTNSDCKAFATDYDLDKLRVKLIGDKTIDDKLVTAKKYFKTKCFSVKQINALTELFPDDETKYRFLDTSYPFVSDTGNFYLLEKLIENDYYKNRFKAMISK